MNMSRASIGNHKGRLKAQIIDAPHRTGKSQHKPQAIKATQEVRGSTVIQMRFKEASTKEHSIHCIAGLIELRDKTNAVKQSLRTEIFWRCPRSQQKSQCKGFKYQACPIG
jgi:hypothetical protein